MDIAQMAARFRVLVFKEWQWLGFGACRFCFFATVLLAAQGGISQQGNAFYLMASSFLCAGALALFGGRSFGSAAVVRTTLTLAFFFQCIGLLAVMLSGAYGYASGAQLGFALLGAGGAYTWVLWSRQLSFQKTGLIFTEASAGFLCSALVLCLLVFSRLPLELTVFLFAAISFVGLQLILKSNDALPDAADGGVSIGFHDMDYSRKAIASVLLLLFTLTFVHNASYGTFFQDYFQTDYMTLSYLGACVLLCLVSVFCHRVGIVVICRVAIPLIALAYIGVDLLPPDFGGICAVVAQTSILAMELFLWIVLMRFAAFRSDVAFRILSVGVLVASAARLLCAMLLANPQTAELLASSQALSLRLLLLVLLMLVVLFIMPTGWKHVEDKRVRVIEGKDLAEQACARLSRQWELSPREGEVLLLAAKGFSQAAMAERLFITEGTVHVHMSHIYQKAGIHNRQELLEAVHASEAAL